jgi:hypothetical protein
MSCATRRFCAVSLVIAAFVFPESFAVPCAPTDGLFGLGDEYAISDLGKLSIVGFSASVSYVSLSAGT